jgi:subtilisin family serine protease
MRIRGASEPNATKSIEGKQMGPENWNPPDPTRKLLLVIALLLSVLPAVAGPRKIARDLEGLDPSKPVDVIVRFNQAPTANLHNKVLSRGGTLNQELRLVRSASYKLSSSALSGLAADPAVESISLDHPLRSTANRPGKWANDYHADSVNAPAAWSQGWDGTGIGIAVIDSGIADVPDLDNKSIVYSQDFVTGSGNAKDQYGHGTHVAASSAETAKAPPSGARSISSSA